MGAVVAGGVGIVGLVLVAATAIDGPLRGALDGATRVGFWSLVLLVAARVGAAIVRSRATGIAHLAWDGAVGLAVVIAGWLGVGLLPGGFRPVTVVGVAILAACVAVTCAWRDPVARFPRHRRTGATTWAGAAVALTLALSLTWNRVPVLFYDTLAYHYAQPELWLLNGRIGAESWSLHSWFPPGMSVLYGVGMALGGERWANDANLLVGVVLALLAFDLGRRWWGGGAGLIGLVLLLAFPQVVYALAIPAADLGHGMFSAAMLGALLAARGHAGSVWVRRAAWLAGGAVLTKYLGFLMLALGAAWVLALRLRAPRRHARGTPGAVLRWVAPAVVLVTPWLFENAVTVGNPIAPVLESVLPVEGLADGGAGRFKSDARGGLPGPADLRQLAPGLVSGSKDGSRVYPTPAWGWTIVALAPVILLGFKDRDVGRLMLLASFTISLWFVTYRWERFLVPTTFLIAVAGAGACVGAWRRGGVARGLPVATGVVAAIAFVGAGQEVARFTGGLPVALGRESPDAYVRRSFPTTQFYDEVGGRVDPVSHVLLVGDARHFRFPLQRTAPSVFNVHPLANSLAHSPDVADTNRELRRLGYTHLLIDLGWIRRSATTYPSLAVFKDRPDLLAGYLASLPPPPLRRGPLVLFEIPEEPPRRP